MSARLSASFWVQAYLTRLRLADIPAFVVARGDATAGQFWLSWRRWMVRPVHFIAALI